MREIVLDTETTGLDPAAGDRIVEIGAVELINGVPSGNAYHVYVNPEREVAEGAVKVHGLTTKFLADHPVFASIVEDFRAFIGEDRLVIHNAEFDVKFINAEFARLNLPPLSPVRVLDTLILARRKHPGQSNTLDALCERYNVDASRRTKHGALLDSELLAEVYLELSGGRQKTLELRAESAAAAETLSNFLTARPAPIPLRALETWEAHQEFVSRMGDKAIWLRYAHKGKLST